MKKGLALLLAASMTISAFASAAGAAELTAQEKFDALKAEGIFTGFEDGSAGLDQNMTRAQAAAIITRILNLSENAAGAASYTDLVGAEWAAGYIGAVTPTYMKGHGNGQFGPSETITVEQLATVMVRVLDLEVEADATVDGEVADWAAGYVAAAIKAGVIAPSADYTQAATREQLVEAAYTANDIVNVPALAAVSAAKATGVQKVEVSFNKAVDTENATLTLKKGNVTVKTTTKWAEDKKSATLSLTDVKVTSGEYTVTLGGVSDIDTAKASASFTAENEKIEKIEFVTASDTVAFADSVIVKARAVNQYGEAASTNAGSYNVYTSGATFTKVSKDANGDLLIELDTDVPGSTTQGVSVIPVTIVNTDNHMTATKNFKLGTQQILSKAELGDARYSVGDALTGKGQNVKFDVHFYDQYGNEITWQNLNRAPLNNNATTVIWNNYIAATDIRADMEDNGNNIPQLKISLLNNLDKTGDYSFTVFNQAATATGVVTIKSTKVATKIELGAVENVIAAGDEDVYIPVIGYDADGNQLSIEDLTSDENIGRISVSLSGAIANDDPLNPVTSTRIEKSGNNKGSIKLGQVTAGPKGAVAVTAVIATANASSTATKTYTVADARVADHLKEVKAPVKSIVPGAKSKFNFNVIDQYGGVFEESKDVTSTGNVGGNIHYEVVATAQVYDANGDLVVVDPTDDDSPAANHADLKIVSTHGSAVQVNATGTKFDNLTNGDFERFNEEFEIQSTADAKNLDRIVFTAEIIKREPGKAAVEVAKVTRTIQVAKSTDDLTYQVKTAASIFNAIDSKSVTEAVYKQPTTSKLAHEIKVSAINAAGDTVALPGSIVQVTSSDQSVAQVGISGGKGYVIGNKTGTATLNIVYKTIKGDTKTASLSVNVKADPIAVATLTAGEKKATVASGANAAVAMDLKAVDNYGQEYKKGEVNSYNFVLGVTYSVQNLVTADTVESVTVAADGTITKVGAGAASFDLVATSASGKSVVTAITMN